MDAHQRFQEWLAAGAEGEPPRDLAIHASVCAACQESMAAFDRLAMVDSGRARMPGGLAAPIPARPAQVPPPIVPPAPPVRAPIAPTPVAPVLAAAPAVQAAVPAKRDPILFKRIPPKVTTLGAASISYPPGSPPPPPGTANGDQGEPRRIGRIAALVLAAVLGALVLGFGLTQAMGLITGFASGPTPTPGQSELQTTQPSASILQPSASPTGTPVPTEVPTPTPTPIPTPKPTPPPPPGAPSSPRNLTAVVSIGHIALSWSAPTSSGGSNIFRYDLYKDGSGTPFWTGNAFSHTDIVGNGATHVYRVTAVNAVGSSAYSSPASGTTPNVPGVPGNPQAQGGLKQVVLTWTTPSNNGKAITGYDIYYTSAQNVVIHHVPFGTNTWTNIGLADATAYSYVVKAVNVIGSSLASSPALATTWGLPGLPGNVAATSGNKSIGITWTAATCNFACTLTYNVYQDLGSTPICTTSGLLCTDSPLGDGVSHTYTVKATNAVGQGLGASSVLTTTWNKPTAPAGVAATGGNKSIGISWGAATCNFACTLTYDVYQDLGSTPICTTSGLLCTDSPLGDGVSHTYTVKATNVIGQGLGASSALTTTWNKPTAPGGVLATGGNASISIGWAAATCNFGCTLTYDVYREDLGLNPVCTTSGFSCLDSGLGDGVPHTYTVRATNVIGQGLGGSSAATTWNKPSTVGNLTASTTETQQITVDWTAATCNFACSLTYDVYRDGVASPYASTSATTFVDTGLGAETHDYYIVARNVVGSGPASGTVTGISLP